MKQFGYVLTHELQARQIGSLVREAARFASSIMLDCGERKAAIKDARRLHGHAGSCLTVTVDGRDEEAAVAAIQNYVVTNM